MQRIDIINLTPEIFSLIPSSVTHLSLSTNDPQYKLSPQALPLSLTHLILTGIHCGDLSSLTSLSHLKISGVWDPIIISSSPSLKSLSLQCFFNPNYDPRSLPSSLTYLELGGKFNNPIENFPLSIQSLVITPNFKNKIINVPPSLTSLFIGGHLTSSLPPLPQTLRSLYLNDLHDNLSNLPVLEKLHVSNHFIPSFSTLPHSLRCLSFRGSRELDSLPPSITSLTCIDLSIKVNNLPPLITYIDFGNLFNYPVTNLPSHVCSQFC